MGRLWKAVELPALVEKRPGSEHPLLMRPRVQSAAHAVESLLETLTDASDRAMISGIGPLKAAWRRSPLPAVSKP